jgi:hypothetical protein
MLKSLRFASLSLLLACGGDGGGTDVTQPPLPVPGVLTLSVTTPNADDRAILITITGPAGASSVTGGSSAYRAESRITGSTIKAAIFGNITSGAVLRFNVPDVAKASSYSASVTEVADASNSLRTDLSAYALSIAKQ